MPASTLAFLVLSTCWFVHLQVCSLYVGLPNSLTVGMYVIIYFRYHCFVCLSVCMPPCHYCLLCCLPLAGFRLAAFPLADCRHAACALPLAALYVPLAACRLSLPFVLATLSVAFPLAVCWFSAFRRLSCLLPPCRYCLPPCRLAAYPLSACCLSVCHLAVCCIIRCQLRTDTN